MRNIFLHAVSGIAIAMLAGPAAVALADASGWTGGTITIQNPIKGADTIYGFISLLINNVILPVASVIVVIFIILAGYQFVTARGNSSQLVKARKNFMWVVIGSAVLLGAWLIARTIETTIGNLRS